MGADRRVGLRRTIGPLLFGVLAWGALEPRAEEAARLPPPPAPNWAFYEAHISAWVEDRCVECHFGGGGALRLGQGLDVAERRRRDFERLRDFVDPQAPWDSRLYLKLLDPADGGEPHAGGAFLARDDEWHDRFLDFVAGATLENLPPEVWFEADEIRAQPGDAVVLDGRGSFDRDRADNEHLAYHWELLSCPAESGVRLSDRRASRLEVVPDVGGTFVLALRVSDGKVWSAPRSITIEALHRHREADVVPGAVSALHTVEEALLRRFRRLYLDVLGRPPTVKEVLSEERGGVRDVAQSILGRAEAGRAWVESVATALGLYGEFRPTSGAARDLALRIPAESLLPHEVEAVLAKDPAFLARHPPGRALASAVPRLLLGREPTSEERALAGRQARPEATEAAPADAVGWIAAVCASEEFVLAALRRRLARFLPSGELDRRFESALGAVRAGRPAFRAWMESLLADPVYLDRRHLRPKDDLTWLRSVFVDLLERRPTDRELVALLRALENMPPGAGARAALVRILIDSGEVPLPLLVDIEDGPRWMTDRFLRYLGRRPDPQESQVYGRALLHPHGGPELVVYGLLTGVEYACR